VYDMILPDRGGREWWEQKGDVAITPCRPYGLGTPTTEHRGVSYAGVPCSSSAASSSEMRSCWAMKASRRIKETSTS
jgi:hypothetical protein